VGIITIFISQLFEARCRAFGCPFIQELTDFIGAGGDRVSCMADTGRGHQKKGGEQTRQGMKKAGHSMSVRPYESLSNEERQG
jgi:hypothetical protein